MRHSGSLCFIRRDIRDTAPLHQQAVGIYAGGRTGHQRTQILTGFNSQIGDIMGQNRMNFPYLIGKGFIQNMQIENIPLPQLLQIREHLLGSHAAVAGDDGMSTFSAHRQRGTQQVSRSSVQRIRACSMVDGKVHADFRYFHIPHYSASTYIQLVNIIFRCCTNGCLRVGFLRSPGGNGFVVRHRTFPDAFYFCGIRLFQHFPVFGLYPGLVPPDIPVADNGIQRQPQCQQKQHSRQKYLQISPLHVLPPRHDTAPEGFSGAVQFT